MDLLSVAFKADQPCQFNQAAIAWGEDRLVSPPCGQSSCVARWHFSAGSTQHRPANVVQTNLRQQGVKGDDATNIHYKQYGQTLSWRSSYLITGEEPSAWLPSWGTGDVWIRVVVWHINFVVTTDILFAQGQGFKRCAMFYLPLTQSWATWHDNTATSTD